MPDRTEFRVKLIKPLLVVLAIEVLLTAATMKAITWSAAHGRPHWAANVPLWDGLANMVLLFGWIAYVQFQKRKTLREQ